MTEKNSRSNYQLKDEEKEESNYEIGKVQKYSLENFRGLPQYLEKITQNIHNIDQRINSKGGMNVSNSTNSVSTKPRPKNEENFHRGYSSNNAHTQDFLDIKSIVKQSVEGLNDIFNIKRCKSSLAQVGNEEQNKNSLGLVKGSVSKGFEVIEEEEDHNQNVPKRVNKRGKNMGTRTKTEVRNTNSNNNNNINGSITPVGTGSNLANSNFSNVTSLNKRIKISSNDPFQKQKKTPSKKMFSKPIDLSEEIGANLKSSIVIPSENSSPTVISSKVSCSNNNPQPTPKRKTPNTSTASNQKSLTMQNEKEKEKEPVKNEKNIKQIKDKISSKISNVNQPENSNKETSESQGGEQNYVVSKAPAVNTNNTNVTVNVNNFINLSTNSPNLRAQSQNMRYEQEFIEEETIQVKPCSSTSMHDNNNTQDEPKKERSPIATKNYQLKPKWKKPVTEPVNIICSNLGGGSTTVENSGIQETAGQKGSSSQSNSNRPTKSKVSSKNVSKKNKPDESDKKSPRKQSSLKKNNSKNSMSGKSKMNMISTSSKKDMTGNPDELSNSFTMSHSKQPVSGAYQSIMPSSRALLKHAGIKDVLKLMLLFNEYIIRNEIVEDSAIADDYSKLLSTLIAFSHVEKCEGKVNEEDQSMERKCAIKIQRAWRKRKVKEYLSKNQLHEQIEMKKVLVGSLVQKEGYNMKKLFGSMSNIVDSFNILCQKSKNLNSMTNQLVQLTNGDLCDLDQSVLYKIFLNEILFQKNDRSRDIGQRHGTLPYQKFSIPEGSPSTQENIIKDLSQEAASDTEEKERQLPKSISPTKLPSQVEGQENFHFNNNDES